MWCISLVALSIPVIVYLCSKTFRALPWTQQVVSAGLVLLLASIVHRPRTYLDAQVIFFVCTLVAFAFDKQRRLNRPPMFFIVSGVYFLWMVLSLIWTNDLHEGQRFLSHMVPLISYPIAFTFICLDKENFNALVRTFMRVAMIGCVLSLGCAIYEAARVGVPCTIFLQLKKFLFMNMVPVYDVIFAWSGACHPSYNAIWMTAAVVAIYYLRYSNLISAFEAFFGCGLTLLVLIMIQSRVGFVMWVIVNMAGLVYLFRKSPKKLFPTLFVFLLLLGAILLANPLWSQKLTADSTRSILLGIARDYITARPILGSGIGGMSYAHVEEVVGYSFQNWWPEYASASAFYPHNQFLGDWMQSGIVGFILLIALLLSVFYDAIRTRRFMPFVFTMALLPLMYIEMPFRFLTGTTIIALVWCFTECNFRPAPDSKPDTSPCDAATNTTVHTDTPAQ